MMTNPETPLKKKPANSYIRYSGLAFQMAGIIIMGVLLGSWIDKKVQKEKPVFTVIFTLVFVIFSLVIVIRQVIKGDT